MADVLKDVTVAILAVDGFEQAELLEPRKALQQAGARAVVISARQEPIQGFKHTEKGETVDVDLTFAEADPEHFAAVLLPGGVVNADEIRQHPKAREFVRRISEAGKPLAVICHGPWLLVSAGLVQGRTLTSWPSLQDDLRNAGANWVDQEVVVDGNWVSSRKPDDIPAFNREFIGLLSKAARPQAA
ncbi:type 1 glutamine amidotransferase domain-containing protein [Bordetella genomosp. 9]|uniref:Protease n=1 Tax=Bordetella genomosp. 9 TaxID=1416803 RepID=A0A1W6YYL2_9BORD|nr:type 1 glutamine amidotransferase domain-containing protein [Bordetella genomosp. 9]ARP86187.1 protease [Bordetella genomosp. 9]ARP90206.1 protease [Bordetella genomosp. 9]